MFQTHIMDSYSNPHRKKLSSVIFHAYMHHGVPYRGAEVSHRPSLNLPIALTSGITKIQILQTHIMES